MSNVATCWPSSVLQAQPCSPAVHALHCDDKTHLVRMTTAVEVRGQVKLECCKHFSGLELPVGQPLFGNKRHLGLEKLKPWAV